MEKHTIIGSGPISLLKACLLAKDNPNLQIDIYTQDDYLGGSWKTETSPLGATIENGCHIWTFQPEVYHFIESFLGLKLQPFRTPPQFIYNGKKYDYSVIKNFEGLKSTIQSILKFKFNRAKSARQYFQIGQNIYQNKYLYPEKGAPEFIAALKNKIDEFDNINLHFNQSITSVNYNPNERIVLQNGNVTMDCDQVYLTSFCKLKEINCNEKTIQLENNNTEYVHFLISLDQAPEKRLSYVRLIGDPLIHRIADISYQTNDEENLILVGVFDTAHHNKTNSKITEHIKTKLIELGGIQSDSAITLEKVWKHMTRPLPNNLRNEILELQPQVNLLQSSDLMFGIKQLLEQH